MAVASNSRKGDLRVIEGQGDSVNLIDQGTENSKLLGLIEELRKRRLDSEELLEKVKKVADKIENIIPQNRDFRSRYLIENKMKIVSEILGVQLSILKHLDDSIRSEFDLRRKLLTQTAEDADSIAIDKLAEAIERYETKKEG